MTGARTSPSFSYIVAREFDIPNAETSAVSSSEIHHCLQNVSQRSAQIRDGVRQYLLSNYHRLFNAIKNTNIGTENAESVHNDLAAIMNQLQLGDVSEGTETSLRALEIKILEAINCMKKLNETMHANEAKIVVLQAVINVERKLMGMKNFIDEGDLINAAQCIPELKREFGISNKETSSTLPGFLVILSESFNELCSDLCLALNSSLNKCIQFDISKHEIQIIPVKSNSSSLNSLSDIFDAMEIAGSLDSVLASMANNFFSAILDAIVCDPSTRLSVNAENNKERPAVISLASVDPSSLGQLLLEPQPAEIYSKLLTAIHFLDDNFLAIVSRQNVYEIFGMALWPKLSESIIRNCLSQVVPDETEEMKKFESVAHATLQFEIQIRRMGLIHTEASRDKDEWMQDTAGDRLTLYTDDVELHFATKRRSRILEAARKLLVKMDFRSVTVGGAAELNPSWFQDLKPDSLPDTLRYEQGASRREEFEDRSFFYLETFQVTTTAHNIVQLVHTTLQETSNSTTGAANQLYAASRDVFTLYRVIVPSLHRDHLENVPGLAMLFQNDCLYIAHQLLFLGFLYRGSLPGRLEQSALFVDMVPLFRKLAEDACNRQLQYQYAQLMEELDSGNGFQFTDDDVQRKAADGALKKVVHHLQRLASIWSPILERQRFIKCVAHLTNSVLLRLAADIQSLQDLTVEESVQLRQLLLGLLHRIPALLSYHGHDHSTGDEETLTFGVDELKALLPGYRKLERLADMLDMSLVAITQAWQAGDLQTCGFSLLEVQKLIEAIFSDTPLRRECIQRICAP